MLNAVAYRLVHIQVVTQWHTAGFDDPGCLVLALARLVDEAFGALSGSLIALLLLLQPLVLLSQLLILLLPFPVVIVLLPLFLILWRQLFRVSVVVIG